ncbi:MAG: LON peptidase substrate-binding domain-containing protein [Alphaproteobacteria bacterium]|nr:LON peptidase substrate-binding domain-containing protein [Alphaproteobacteria bacterium]MCB9793424.1 LON peptidase substrate-binding domain-containing protein [Alphaproteobacteria bacterium]
MSTPPSSAQLAHLPFFPLPGLVFFPGTLLPLHLFEPRYRRMIAWCIENDSPLAVVRIQEGYESQQPGDPPVEAVCGVGRLVRHVRTEDGRYNVVLEGCARLRIVEELRTDEPFRVARAELLSDSWPDDASSLALRVVTLRGLAASLAQVFPAAASALGALVSESPSRLVDGLAALVLTEPAARQQALDTLDVMSRAELVEQRMIELLTPAAVDEPVADA